MGACFTQSINAVIITTIYTVLLLLLLLIFEEKKFRGKPSNGDKLMVVATIDPEFLNHAYNAYINIVSRESFGTASEQHGHRGHGCHARKRR